MSSVQTNGHLTLHSARAFKKADRTSEQRKRAEEIIERQVAHMSRFLDDLLDISRITRGTLELKKSPTELTLAIGTAIETGRPVLDAKHHTPSLDLPKAAWHRHSPSLWTLIAMMSIGAQAADFEPAEPLRCARPCRSE